jgi:GNAT superfamily N-acetyltransferase
MRATRLAPLNTPAPDNPAVRSLLAGESQALAALRHSQARATVFLGEDGEAVEGVVCWTSLKWDTQQFGFPAARLDVCFAQGRHPESRRRKAELVRHVVEECRAEGIRHLSARIPAQELSTVHALEETGFEYLGGLQTFSTIPARSARAESYFNIRTVRRQDVSQLLEIARTAFVYDRFHCDPALPEGVADRLHVEWVKNCCSGSQADVVFVAAAGSEVIGFLTCSIDRETATGTIGLVATAQNSRRSGVARGLTYAALEWFEKQQTRQVEVGTQLANIPAARVYQSCGFKPESVSLSYRRVI